MDVVVTSSTADHAFGVLANVVLYAWKRVTGESALPAMASSMSVARASGAQRTILLGVVERGAHLPSSAMRRAMSAEMRRWDTVRASALAFEGTGFQASAVRGVATGLALLGGFSYPHRVFATVPLAAAWLWSEAESGGVPCPTVPELLAAMDRLRSS